MLYNLQKKSRPFLRCSYTEYNVQGSYYSLCLSLLPSPWFRTAFLLRPLPQEVYILCSSPTAACDSIRCQAQGFGLRLASPF